MSSLASSSACCLSSGPLAPWANQPAIGQWNLTRFAEALLPLLAAADLYLFPSESESFGLSALEALASGVPVVAARVGGVPEVVVDGVTGALLTLGTHPARLAEEQMRTRMRPALSQTLLAVELTPRSVPEQVAFDKLVEDSLD